MNVTAILLCAGSSLRMGFDKLLIPVYGKTPLERSFRTLESVDDITHIIMAVSSSTREAAQELSLESRVPVTLVTGGAQRQQSVYNALEACRDADIVVIHDAARCLVSADLVHRTIASAKTYGSGVAGVCSSDTVKLNENRTRTLPRENIWLAQTPQTFRYDIIKKAYELAKQRDVTATDDASLIEHIGGNIQFVESSKFNIKLTTREDLIMAEALIAREAKDVMRIGYGEDMHRLVRGRPLIIGGVEIDYESGLDGHSDADVLTHALIDALLGAVALGDIGRHFPDSDDTYLGISSIVLLKETMKKLRAEGCRVINADATIVAESPRLAPHTAQMRRILAGVLGIEETDINIKATTNEGLGPEGNHEGIGAKCVVLIEKNVKEADTYGKS